jgi:hypothetical protein
VIWLYLTIAVFLLLIGSLLLRVRIRLQLDPHHRLLFLGLGRSGSELDFVAGLVKIKLAGVTVKELPLEEDEPSRSKTTAPGKPVRTHPVQLHTMLWRKTRREFNRLRQGMLAASGGTFGELLATARIVLKAVFLYIVDVIRDSRLEEFQAQVEGGFDSPDLTGQAYGYWCALAGALPSTAGRVVFVPDWTGASLTGSARVSIAIPLYLLVYRTVRLLLKLPMKSIIRMARQKNKGGSDVQ